MSVELLQGVFDFGGGIAVALVVYVWLKLKTVEKRLDDGDKRFSEQDSQFKEMKSDINSMSRDVSFIRGIMEGKEQK